MGNYLADRRKELGLTMKQVADAVGVSEGTVSRWESGAIANMRRDRIYALAKVLRVRPTFVMTGETTDLEPPIIHNRIKELRIQNGWDQKTLAAHVCATTESVAAWEAGYKIPEKGILTALANLFDCSFDYLLGRTSTPYPPEWPSIPILGNVAAGTPAEAVENIIGYEEISPTLAATGEFFALRVDGDSMEPRMKKGDIVIVRKQEDVESGDIAVVLVNGDAATIKRIKKRPEGIMLIPSNPSFEPMFYTNEEINTLPVSIIGKVVELHAKI